MSIKCAWLFFEDLFRQRNFSEQEARARGYVAYAMMMGNSILKDTLDAPPNFVEVFVDSLIGDHASPQRRTIAKIAPIRSVKVAVEMIGRRR